jgi:hypothetical protein
MMIPPKYLLAACVAMAATAIVLICWVLHWQVRRAVAEVESLNGSVDDRGDAFLGPEQVTFAIMGREQILDDSGFQRLLPYLKHFRRLKSLDLSGTGLTPDGLMGIDDLTTLKRLDLPDHCVSERSISAIAGLKSIEVLYIYGSATPTSTIERLRGILPTTRIHLDKSRWSQPAP